MPFTFSVGFATEHDKQEFESRTAPKVRGQQVDAPAVEGAEGLHRVGLSVTSQSAAKETCHLLLAFLAHAKNSRVTLHWTGADGQPQTGQVEAGQPRDAEVIAMRLGAAAKAALDAEKAS
jgi:hypothetical protein